MLLANKGDTFLPTISSRCSQIKLEKPNEDSVLLEVCKSLNLNEDEAKVLWMQAGKGSRSLAKIARDDSLKRASLESLSDAKRFLGAKDYEKLTVLKNRLSKREDALSFLDALLVLLEIIIEKNPKNALALKPLAEKIELAISGTKANANLRIQLLSLV